MSSLRPVRRTDHVAQPHPGAGTMPDPRPLAMNLARAVLESLAGVKDLEQIARWVDAEVYTRLLRRVVLADRARSATRRAATMPRIDLGSTHLESPAAGVVEAVVVVHMPDRTRAVTMRLEDHQGRWCAVQLAVL